MTRWFIEKSGTGIEKSGTGIEKSGTGIKNSMFATTLLACVLASQVSANEIRKPIGNLQLVADQLSDTVAVSWIFDGSVFSGAANLQGSYASFPLTEVSVAPDSLQVVGGGTGTEVVGGGTGKDVVGGGTGIEVVGGGTGTEVVGGGTGIEVVGGGTGIEVVGGGTGTEVVGGGTGTEVVGGGTGSGTLVVGGGTGSEAIAITLPRGTGMHMEITMGCSSATVSVLDSNSSVVTTFNDVPVIGNTGLCARGGSGAGHARFEAAMR